MCAFNRAWTNSNENRRIRPVYDIIDKQGMMLKKEPASALNTVPDAVRQAPLMTTPPSSLPPAAQSDFNQQPKKTGMYDYWGTPVVGKMPLDRFVQLTGMAANAIAPDSPGGRLGAGLAGIGGEAVQGRMQQEEKEIAREEERRKFELERNDKRFGRLVEVAAKSKSSALTKRVLGSIVEDWNKNNPDSQMPELEWNDETKEFISAVAEIRKTGSELGYSTEETNQLIRDELLARGLSTPTEWAKDSLAERKSEKLHFTNLQTPEGLPVSQDPVSGAYTVPGEDGKPVHYNGEVVDKTAEEKNRHNRAIEHLSKLRESRGSGKTKTYTQQQLIDDTRGHYGFLMKTLLDEDGLVKEGMEGQYKSLTDKFESDVKLVGKGESPSWLVGEDQQIQPNSDTNINNKQITKDIAIEYLKKTNGDKQKAREFAIKDGYKF